MKGNNTVGFGVIGATSHVAQVGVIPAIEGANNSRIVAMSSRTFRENDLSTSGVRLYRDYRDLLEDAEVDAVYVALPNHLHHEVVIEAITSKKHVLCEKPMAISGKDLQEMHGAAQKNRVALAEAARNKKKRR
jgi:xylose dehydrogenase (NAD/NADP)